MGVFEEGFENGTLHFHALLYVPEHEMIGRIEKKREYSTKRGERLPGMEIHSLTRTLGYLISRR